MNSNNKILSLLLLVMFAFPLCLTSAQDLDSLRDVQNSSNFKFGVRFGVQASHFDFGDFRFLEVPKDAQIGGSFGFSLDWKIKKLNRFRLEPHYMCQALVNHYEQQGNSAIFKLKNHIAGLDVFPVVLTIGNKFKPTVSIGGYYRYLLSSKQEVILNGRMTDTSSIVLKTNQYGVVLGAGIYVGKKLVELRIYKPSTDLFEDIEGINKSSDISLIIYL